jgi:hypothetical protein
LVTIPGASFGINPSDPSLSLQENGEKLICILHCIQYSKY